ncbi:hypothetical protein AGABI1DRAFT_107565 [Agaricus bisporus var. burnettii JB137-S8]|uniref:Nephrocystin 3-like N-terminal domain-containing protein n=1 Tax=Agaricus bisporus var. burnettii (strain JB137-S8 / ATCC MYA-4627 / FGSC 10392) TaxID=597362 RepID=K5VV56_AGABU|nr:uncharacterized protein AGABI1DRAFT_107565 [Agaricus bisporus var. burnettii JB137-S8]EKM78364.1 hypothetical protein AGABI1DRAFT_107565 [Agaricus bisporus var. burnettii JB137-S8]
MPMLVETFKSFITRFKVHRPTRDENATNPTLSHPPLTAGSGQVRDLASTSTFSSVETRPSIGTSPGSSIAASKGNLPTSISQTPTPASDPTPATGFFPNAHDMVINNPTMFNISNTFDSGGGAIMQLLESKTIQGAEHDSSARYPPPKCHPDTRQSLRGQILGWIFNPQRSWRMFYVLGTAGVGKSAVAQTAADYCKEADRLGASCFISRPNHRNDPNGIIPTLAYQLAVKHDVYKRIISQKIAQDPTILRKTRRVQFKALLIDPFHIIMTQDPSAIHNPLLIIIDGLDECESEEAQCEFIELISDHVRSFPEFPLLWLICSRPEWHLKYTMSQADFQVTCRREEILIDDEEGQRDVLIYLRSEFHNIRLKYPASLRHDWPHEDQLQRIARAASGLFAFASTIMRFIDDADAGDPLSQLRICIKILEGSNTSGVENPYLTLDLLYRHILASIPSKIRPTTMRIIGMSLLYPHHGPSQTAHMQANFLHMGKAAFDHALKRIHSVLRIGSPSDAFDDPIEFYHASFGDFLLDPVRSGEFCLDEAAVHYDVAFTALRWHTDLTYEIQEDDIWFSLSEDVQTCLENVKAQSLVVLWRACSHVKGIYAMNLYQELQNLDFFSVLGSDIPWFWEFDDFLDWLNLQERDSLTQKLINLANILDHCDEVTFTRVTIPSGRMPYFIEEAFDSLHTAHLNLGNGNNRRHVHITYDIPFVPPCITPETVSDLDV